MELSSSSLSHYRVTEVDSGYEFQCQLGSVYRVAFSDASKFVLGASFAKNTFIIDLIRIKKAKTETLTLPDQRIGLTVSYILTRTFESNPAAVIIYYCSTAEGIKKQKRRANRFREWIESNKDLSNQKIGSYYYEEPDMELYSGCVFVQDYHEEGEVIEEIKLAIMSKGKMPNY